jgi:hypothetical protein
MWLMSQWSTLLPDLDSLALYHNVFAEPGHEKDRIVLWVRGARDGPYRLWERVSTLRRAQVLRAEPGVCRTAATSLRARQRFSSFLRKIADCLTKNTSQSMWSLPDGRLAEQLGARRSDRVLVWSERSSTTLDEVALAARWPDLSQFQQIGQYLYLATGAHDVLPESVSVEGDREHEKHLVRALNGLYGNDGLQAPLNSSEVVKFISWANLQPSGTAWRLRAMRKYDDQSEAQVHQDPDSQSPAEPLARSDGPLATELSPGKGTHGTPRTEGWLRMATSAATASAKFVGSGLKVVSSETRQRRLRVCASCEHHTGMRCRVCGCFTSAKTWLPHEACPIGRWPAQSM